MLHNYTFPDLKPLLLSNHCEILATSAFLPDTVVSNQQIIAESGLKVTDRVIQKTLGMAERRVAARGLADTDLMVPAANDCLKKAGLAAAELSKLIVNKFLGDALLPMNASMLQAKMDCPVAIQAFDIDGGVHSFFQAVDMAVRMINCGDRYILIVSGGMINRFVKTTDARHAFLFGDAATAVLLGPSDTQHIRSTYMFSNYDYAGLSIGMEIRKKARTDLYDTDDYAIFYDLYQMEDWSPAIPFIREAAAHTCESLLRVAGMDRSMIDVLIVSEYTKQIREAILDAVNMPAAQTISVLHKYGNTLSAMLPLLLWEGFEAGRFTPGMRAMIISLGEGISGGGCIYQF